jgi:hypothetical protein
VHGARAQRRFHDHDRARPGREQPVATREVAAPGPASRWQFAEQATPVASMLRGELRVLGRIDLVESAREHGHGWHRRCDAGLVRECRPMPRARPLQSTVPACASAAAR